MTTAHDFASRVKAAAERLAEARVKGGMSDEQIADKALEGLGDFEEKSRHAAAEKFGDCRVAGGLTDEDIARQILEAVGIAPPPEETPEAAEPEGHAEPAPKAQAQQQSPRRGR
jgi:hypothetical protein